MGRAACVGAEGRAGLDRPGTIQYSSHKRNYIEFDGV